MHFLYGHGAAAFCLPSRTAASRAHNRTTLASHHRLRERETTSSQRRVKKNNAFGHPSTASAEKEMRWWWKSLSKRASFDQSLASGANKLLLCGRLSRGRQNNAPGTHLQRCWSEWIDKSALFFREEKENGTPRCRQQFTLNFTSDGHLDGNALSSHVKRWECVAGFWHNQWIMLFQEECGQVHCLFFILFILKYRMKTNLSRWFKFPNRCRGH